MYPSSGTSLIGSARYLRPYVESREDLRTDYEPCWGPLHGLQQRHDLPRMRFPWKTAMDVFVDARY